MTEATSPDEDSDSSEEQAWVDKDSVPDPIKLQWESEQEEMKKQMVLTDSPEVRQILDCYGPGNVGTDTELGKMFYIGGVDVSFVKGDNVNACAALVVIEFPSLKLVYEDNEMIQLTLPYIPGFLGFREVPHIVRLFTRLKESSPQYTPQVIMVDGNGVLHPRGFGSACHLGVALDVPCIGVAKKLFHVDGLEKSEAHQAKIEQLDKGGATFPLIGDSGHTLGMALRSSDGTKTPVYISTGHKICLDTAVWLAHTCCKYRIPEPVRWADLNSREFLRVNFKSADEEDIKDKLSKGAEKEDIEPWKVLEHSGPLFPPSYDPLPAGVHLLYNGKLVHLPELAEEAMVNYCKLLVREENFPSNFSANFLRTWRQEMTEKEREIIQDLDKCDFSHICTYTKEQTEKRKHLSAEERKNLRIQNENLSAIHGFCLLNGKKEKIMNFRVSPPGIFHGRGDHPMAGTVKKRIQPEDVTINCSRDSKVPTPPEGHTWKEVRHDHMDFWLAQWMDNSLTQTVFMCPVSYRQLYTT